jgi:hypothetical protein
MASLEGLSEEQIRSLASLAKDLTDDAGTRNQFQRLVKQRQPGIIFPELEVEDKVSAATKQLAEQNEALRNELQNDRLARQRREIEQNLAQKYPDLPFKDIEDTMVKHAIGSHESAAMFLANERTLSQPAPEIPGRGGPMMMPSEARQFFKSPTQVSRKLAHEVVTDIMNKRNRARAAA